MKLYFGKEYPVWKCNKWEKKCQALCFEGSRILLTTAGRMWGSAKWRNTKRCGTARHHLGSYFTEFLFSMCGEGGGERSL